METSTRYFNDYDIYESKSCFFRQGVETREQKVDIKLEQPFFTEESFKPDEPEPVVKTLDEFIFLYSTIQEQPQPQPQPQPEFEKQVFGPRKPFYLEYSSEYTSRSFLDTKASMYSAREQQARRSPMYTLGVKELNY
jgi:hypothetical protein